MDWSPLASDDPLPGEVATIDATGRRFQELAEALAQLGGRALRIDPDAVWSGLAAQQFADARDRVPRQLRALSRRCGLAGEALTRWAGDVDGHQAMGRVARDRAREAEADIARANDGVRQMRAHAQAAAREAAAWNTANPAGPYRHPDPWPGPDWHAALADAQQRLTEARRDFAEVVAAYRQDADTAADGLADADRLLDDPAWLVGPLARMAAGLLSAPAAFDFVVTDDGLVLNTRESWLWETYRQAGIDPGAWDPSRGLAALDDTVVAAWEFYADLYERDPDRFLWSGMATLAGGTFYGAFQDIHVLRRALEDGSVTADQVGDILRRIYPGLPGAAMDQLTDLAAQDLSALATEVAFVEQEFLHMQRLIFDDLAWQHVAVEAGGLDAMEALYDRGDIDRVHIGAWRDIVSGDPQRIRRGNRDLLFHEQWDVIGQEYDQIRDRSHVTWLMTMGMSVVAGSPVPGGQPFRDVVPYRVAVDIPDRVPVVPSWLLPERVPIVGIEVPGGRGVYVDTPAQIDIADLPLNNVSISEHRWQWIEQDMLPAWLDHVDQGTAGALVAEPIHAQGTRQRLIPDWLLTYEPEGS